MRERIHSRFFCMFHHYKVVGHKSVSWIQKKEIGEMGFDISPLNFPIKLKKTSGFNSLVTEDIKDDSIETYIVSMKNFYPQKSKDHFACYIHCNIESIFATTDLWVVGWNLFTLFFATIFGFAIPYCSTFDDPTINSDSFYCEIFSYYHYLSFAVHFLDVLAEIYVATPSKGLFYRIRDGLKVSIRKVYFWLDVLAVVPFGVIVGEERPSLGQSLRSFFKCAKVFRFLCNLDNVFPLQIFAVRMGKALVLIVYVVHLIACILFGLVCPYGKRSNCNEDSWLSSYYRNIEYNHLNEGLKETVLIKKSPYLLSLWFSTATVTSAGFGDFTPQSQAEIWACLLFMVGGVFFVAYIIGGLAAALTCGIRPKLMFQQKLSSIRIFLQHHNLSGKIQERIIEHYVLQDKLKDGIVVSDPSKHLLYDAPRFIAEDTLFWEVETFLEGVPLFTKSDPVIMTRMAKLMKRYLLPPDLTFVDRGEVRRSMYVVCKGSVGLFTTEKVETGILEATGHFGIRDLLFGEPHEFFIKTKSYVILYAIDFQNFVDSFEGYDEEMMELLYREKTRISERVHDLVFVRGINTHLYDKSEEKPVKIRSFILLPWRKNMTFSYCTYQEYRQIFHNVNRLSWLYRYFLMPITIHPAGVFAKIWNSFITVTAMVNFTICFVELFMQARPPGIRYFQLAVDAFSWTNIYLKLHWCYFDENNLLISHPAKTAYNYIFHGLFIFDILFVTRFEMFLVVRGVVNIFGYGKGANWFTKIRMNQCLQIYRFPELFRIVHSIFQYRTLLLVLFYLLVLYWITSTLGCIAIYLACPGFARSWASGDEYRMPACVKDSWMLKEIIKVKQTSVIERWVLSIYYVLQAILTVGFGDIVHINVTEISFLIPVTMFGYILMQVVIADITAAEVDTNENRALFLEDRRCLLSCLWKENAPYKVLNTIDHHLDFVWEESRGCQPRELFVDLHPSLASDVFEEFVGDTLSNVPLFQNFSTQVLRSMSKLLKKQYFLKGSRLTRFGNLEYEMFVIVDGRVYMVDAENNYMTTLKKNQFFGEISMLYGRPRKHSAIAASKVEVFVLSADDFAELIEKYPTVKEEIIKALKKEKKEIWFKTFLRKKRADPTRWERNAKALNIAITRMLRSREIKIVKLVGENKKSKAFKFKFKRWVAGYGPDDDKLPFLYFAVPSYEKITFKFLIHPNCIMWIIMTRLVLCIYYVSVMITLYLTFFVNHAPLEVRKLDTVTRIVKDLGNSGEICVAVYILLKFFVPFEIGYNTYCKEWRKIVFRYISDPRQFLLDAVAAIPVELIIPQLPTRIKYDEYLVFIQFVRLIRFYGALMENKNSLRVNTLLYKLTIALTVFLLSGHTLACILYNAAKPEKEILDPSWVSRLELSFRGIPEDEKLYLHLPSIWYLRSLYFMMTIMTSCGFGDNLPQSFKEYLLVCVTMLFGAIGTAIVLGNFSAGLAALQQAKREYFYKINTHVKHLKGIGLSDSKGNLLLSYYIALWDVGRGQPYHKAAAILPLTMQFDCCAILFGEVIMKCSFFGEPNDESFIRNIAIRMVHSVYFPGINIVNQGEPGNTVYIVYKGVVCSYMANEFDKMPEFRHKFTKYECFGRSSCLFKNMMYGKSYRAETRVEMLQIDQSDVVHIARHYPLWKDYLERLIHKRFEHTSHLRKHIFNQETTNTETPHNITTAP
ncbi:unnamed protein product [Allacma fusca]|uniref:Cyclic nucleotide-binding domain-containing protein n=1 Tax=Allacma fusca TaxID=39272 RepID=A0A8J2PBJ9_9HEXA|nr:unnamed protein product [Allacma fusca]